MPQVQEKVSGITTEALQAITPHLVCGGAADAIDFYRKAFGAEEVMRLAGPNGKLMHALIRIGNANVMLVDEAPEWGSLSPLTLGGSPVRLSSRLFISPHSKRG